MLFCRANNFTSSTTANPSGGRSLFGAIPCASRPTSGFGRRSSGRRTFCLASSAPPTGPESQPCPAATAMESVCATRNQSLIKYLERIKGAVQRLDLSGAKALRTAWRPWTAVVAAGEDRFVACWRWASSRTRPMIARRNSWVKWRSTPSSPEWPLQGSALPRRAKPQNVL